MPDSRPLEPVPLRGAAHEGRPGTHLVVGEGVVATVLHVERRPPDRRGEQVAGDGASRGAEKVEVLVLVVDQSVAGDLSRGDAGPHVDALVPVVVHGVPLDAVAAGGLGQVDAVLVAERLVPDERIPRAAADPDPAPEESHPTVSHFGAGRRVEVNAVPGPRPVAPRERVAGAIEHRPRGHDEPDAGTRPQRSVEHGAPLHRVPALARNAAAAVGRPGAGRETQERNGRDRPDRVVPPNRRLDVVV